MFEDNNPPLLSVPRAQQPSNDPQGLLMCEDYFDNFDTSNQLSSNAPAPQPPSATLEDFEAQIQAMLAASNASPSNINNLSFCGLPWMVENEGVSSPESRFSSDILSSPDFARSPHSYDDNLSLPALSPPALSPPALSPPALSSPLFDNLGDLGSTSEAVFPFDPSLSPEPDPETAIAQTHNTKKRQTGDGDLLLGGYDDKLSKKKRKETAATKYKKPSTASKTAKKKGYVKDEPTEAGGIVSGRSPVLCMDSTATLGGSGSIVVPSSPTFNPSANYNATTLLALNPGVWPQAVSSQPPYTLNGDNNGLVDVAGQYQNIPMLGLGRDATPVTKLPIHRLKPPVGPQPTATVQLQPNKQQKKVAHNAIERRYRNNLNDRINDLKSVVPALCHLKSKDSKEDDDDNEIDGVQAATKLNKATILRKATEYIVHLKKSNQKFKDEVDTMRKILEAVPGGIELYNELAAKRAAAGEDSQSESDDHDTSATQSSGNRTLLAIFTCVTFFSSPSSYVHQAHGEHHHEGRVTGGAHIGSTSRSGFLGGDDTITIDLWYLMRIIMFILCLVLIFRPSLYSNPPRHTRKSKSVVAALLATKTKDAKVLYQSLSSLPTYIPTSGLELVFGIGTELFKFAMRRLVGWNISGGFSFQDNEEKLYEVALWGRLGEVELCGGYNKASRLSILYNCFHTVNLLETTYTTRKHIFSPSRIYATAALQSYIGFRPISFLAQRMASRFWDRAIRQRGHRGQEEKWLEVALKCDQDSEVWRAVVNRIGEQVLHTREAAADSTTTIPLAYISDVQALVHLKQAFYNFISVQYGKKKPKKGSLTFGDHLTFEDLLIVTTPASLTHWYALAGRAVSAFSKKDNNAGEKLVKRLKEECPKSEENSNVQIIAMGLLSYALLMNNKIEASVRCADNAWSFVNRRNAEDKNGLLDDVNDEQDYEICRMEREVHYLAEFCVGWLVLEARVLSWKVIESLTAENKSLTLPEMLDSESCLKPAVQSWLIYLRRLAKVNVLDGISEAREGFLRQLHALTRVVGGLDEKDDSGCDCEVETESGEKGETENRAGRAWSVLKGM